MLKFFRKYNVQILAIVTVLLMVVFIGGDALQAILTPNEAAIILGQAYGRSISRADLAAVENQIRILRNLEVWGQEAPPMEELDYLLLIREAQHEGLSPSVEQARAQLADSDLDRFSLINKVSTTQIEQAVANYLLVVQMWSAARQSILTSELEIRQAVRDRHEKISAEVVEIKSSPLINPDDQIAESAMQEHFQRYREQTPTGSPLGFGYLIPNRVQVEYLKIASDTIPLTQPITARQAETYWQKHQQDFRRPAESTLLDAPDKPSTPYYTTFAEARDDVVKHLTKQAQVEEARIMASMLESVLRSPWYNLTAGASGFPPVPEAVQQTDYYEKTPQSLGERLKHPSAISVGRTEFFSTAEAAKQPDIGAAREDTQSTSRGQPFGARTHLVEGLVDLSATAPSARSSVLALYQTAPVLMINDQSNLYLYRVIAVQKQQPPASLDEVRDRVIADIRAAAAFDLAKSHAERVRSQVSADGLKAAWEAYDGLPPEMKEQCGHVWESNPFARVFELVPGIRFPVTVSDQAGRRDQDGKPMHEIRSEQFVDKTYELLETGGLGAAGVIPMPELEKCFVVQVSEVQHLTPQDYESHKKSMKDQVGREREMALTRDWFSPEGLRSRTEYKPGQPG